MPDETEDQTAEPDTTPEVVEEAVEETVEPVFDAQAAHQSQQATNEQLAGVLRQQSEALQGMQAAIESMAKPAPVAEEEYTDPTEQALAGMQAQLNRLEGRAVQKDQGEYVEKCVGVAARAVDKLIATHPLTKANPVLAKKIRAEAITGTRNHVGADPNNRTMTDQQVSAWFSMEMQTQQAIIDAQPGQKATNAANQAAVNKKSVEMPGGVSPTQEPDKPLDPDTDAYWEAKSRMPIAASNQMGET